MRCIQKFTMTESANEEANQGLRPQSQIIAIPGPNLTSDFFQQNFCFITSKM